MTESCLCYVNFVCAFTRETESSLFFFMIILISVPMISALPLYLINVQSRKAFLNFNIHVEQSALTPHEVMPIMYKIFKQLSKRSSKNNIIMRSIVQRHTASCNQSGCGCHSFTKHTCDMTLDNICNEESSKG
jgi:hypothetical protein